MPESVGLDCKNNAKLEQRTRDLGAELLDGMRRGASLLSIKTWEDRLTAWTLDDPELKVQLFRFVDALPTLRTDAEIRRHLLEYLGEAGDHVPWWLNGPLSIAPESGTTDRVLGRLARWSAMRMAGKFIAGATPGEAARTVLALRRRKLAFTADLLGEAVISEAEADAYQHTCIELLKGLSGALAGEPEVKEIDGSTGKPIPRVNLSLKLTSLTARFDAIHPEATRDRVLSRLRPILRTAHELEAHVHVDMEQYSVKDLTYNIFKEVAYEPEFRDWRDFGIVSQAYLKETEADLEELLRWVRQRGRRSWCGW